MSEIDLDVLKLIIHEIKDIKDHFVFVGGATISLHVDEPQHIDIRETFDVDCIVEVVHRRDYEEISKKLRSIGFSEAIDSSVLCRFQKKDLILDVMPTSSEILGFTNIWYKEGFEKNIKKKVNGVEISVFDLPYLIAAKIEAFKGRGQGHFMTSHDIEDIVTLFDGCSYVAEKINTASETVKTYLKNELSGFLNNPQFISSLDGHISSRANISGRKKKILERMKSSVI